MWDKVHSLQNTALNFISQMQMQHWLLAFLVVVVLGVTCMRGFSSRIGY